MTLSAVLFDCDGVIVDSERPMMQLLHQDMLSFGLEVDFEEMVTMNLGGAVPQFAPRLREMGADVPQDWVETFYKRLYAILEVETPLIPDIELALKAIQSAGLDMAIGSNGRHEKMEITLGHHPDIRAYFGDRIYSGQALGRLKPDPELYLHMADELGVAPETCVVIEDSPTGARAAKRAGMRCFGYEAHGEGAVLAAEGAEVFTDMRDLPGLLGLN